MEQNTAEGEVDLLFDTAPASTDKPAAPAPLDDFLALEPSGTIQQPSETKMDTSYNDDFNGHENGDPSRPEEAAAESVGAEQITSPDALGPVVKDASVASEVTLSGATPSIDLLGGVTTLEQAVGGSSSRPIEQTEALSTQQHHLMDGDTPSFPKESSADLLGSEKSDDAAIESLVEAPVSNSGPLQGEESMQPDVLTFGLLGNAVRDDTSTQSSVDGPVTTNPDASSAEVLDGAFSCEPRADATQPNVSSVDLLGSPETVTVDNSGQEEGDPGDGENRLEKAISSETDSVTMHESKAVGVEPTASNAESESHHEMVNEVHLEHSQEPCDPSAAANSPATAESGDLQLISRLGKELARARAQIELLQKQASNEEERKGDDDGLLAALQSNLQHQMSAKAEAENRARLAETQVKELESTIESQRAKIQQFEDFQESLQQQMSAKAEAENKARLALERVQQLESEKDQQVQGARKVEDLESKLQQQISLKAEAENNAKLALERVEELESREKEQNEEIVSLQKNICEAREAQQAQLVELQKIREERDEQHRKEVALTSRLNAAKMKESVKGNLAEQYEDDIKAIEQELEDFKKELMGTKTDKRRLEEELDQLKVSTKARVDRAEKSLAEERQLYEERKRKMKAFVETKVEEIRQKDAENEALQMELNQTTKSLADVTASRKQLQAQYVQSQTRNRELLRENSRYRKDSENLHKVGDSLEMKLSRSTTATEEHKNKRIAAKHELMTVLRTLEAERDVTAKLRDTIKFTFTPKALSQQQLLQESLEEFEAQLQKLALRLGRPLPPSTVEQPIIDASEASDHSAEGSGSADGKVSRSDADISRLISKLERETQAVSQCIMALTGNVERMHLVLDASGERSCYTVLGELFTTGGVASSPALQEHGNDESAPGSQRRLGAVRSTRHRYGTVPSAATH